MSGTNFSPLTARDGTNLIVMDWPLEKGPVRGVVLIVHGLGEHAWRYDLVAQRLNSWGFAVRAYDQYGHGESMGQRGALPSTDRLLEDLAEVIDDSRARMHADTPLIVLGHSMGGLVAARVTGTAADRGAGVVVARARSRVGLVPEAAVGRVAARRAESSGRQRARREFPVA